MQSPENNKHQWQKTTLPKLDAPDLQLKAIAYSMDALIPGLYTKSDCQNPFIKYYVIPAKLVKSETCPRENGERGTGSGNP